MDTRTPEDLVDERLRDAASRLRAEAPSPALTEAALGALGKRAGPLRRLWWALPAGLVTAAAATIGVLVLAGQQDDAEPDVPSETPVVTPAPTSPPTPAPTATPTTTGPGPDPVPSFAGDPPLSSSAAALGCPGTLGDIAAAMVPSSDEIAGLVCVGDNALVSSGGVITRLERGERGSWTRVGSQPAAECRRRCPLPIPPPSLLGRDLGDLSPVDVTPQVRDATAAVEVSDPAPFARSLGARLAIGAEPEPTVNAEVVNGAEVLLITLGGLGDDSADEVTYVVWYDGSGPTLAVERAFLITRCSRGVAVDEAGESLDLCI